MTIDPTQVQETVVETNPFPTDDELEAVEAEADEAISSEDVFEELAPEDEEAIVTSAVLAVAEVDSESDLDDDSDNQDEEEEDGEEDTTEE